MDKWSFKKLSVINVVITRVNSHLRGPAGVLSNKPSSICLRYILIVLNELAVGIVMLQYAASLEAP